MTNTRRRVASLDPIEQVLSIVGDMREEMKGLREDISHAASKDDLKALLPRDTYDAYHQQVVNAEKANAEDIRDLRVRHDLLEREVHDAQLADARRLADARELAQRDLANAREVAQRDIGTAREVAQKEVTGQRIVLDDRMLQWLVTGLIAVAVGLAIHLIH